MSSKYLIVVFIAIAIIAWLLSEFFSTQTTIAKAQMVEGEVDTPSVPLVRAKHSLAQAHELFLTVNGQTHSDRIVDVKAEVFGLVEAIPAVKGTIVKQGDQLCKIAVGTKQSDLQQAKAELKSAILEYQGILYLRKRNLQSDMILAKAEVVLETSRAQLARAELALAKTTIIAPFAGVIEAIPVEIGDFLDVGRVCVTLMEIDPILVVGQVSERSVDRLVLGSQVVVELITGVSLQGKLKFISRSPDTTTRAYAIEAIVKNPGQGIRAGLSAELKVSMGAQQAHHISSASIVLNDAGKLGVKIVDNNTKVQFKTVEIIDEDMLGVWIHGLPQEATIITVGQAEVFDGEEVRVDFSPLGNFAGSS